MKKSICFIIAAVFATCLCFAACGTTPEEQPETKTLFTRAQELAEYYDAVPSDFKELTGTDKAKTSADCERKVLTAKSKSSSAYKNATTYENGLTFTPESRPRPTESGVTGEEWYYTQNGVDASISKAKSSAVEAKERFQNKTRLNVWKRYGDGGFERLNYDKQLDKISREFIFDYMGNGSNRNEFFYNCSQLFLGKNHKINYSCVSYFYNGDSNSYGGHFYEYVEDDYYYWVHDSGYKDAMNYVLFIDLKTKPATVYSAQNSYGSPSVTKSINLELEDGKKLSYVFRNYGVQYLYGSDRNVMMAKRDNRISLDLWQAGGWKKVEASGFNAYTLTTDREIAVNDREPLYEDEENRLELNVSISGNFSDGHMLFNLDIIDKNNSSGGYDIMEKVLNKAGLFVKNDFSDLFERYFSGSFDEAVSGYSAPKFDFAAMDAEEFDRTLAGIKAEEKLSVIREDYKNIEVYEPTGEEEFNEAYLMLDTVTAGEASVSFDDFKIDFSDVSVKIPDSVLLEEGRNYFVKAGLYNGESFVELADAQSAYANGDIEISLSSEVSLLKDIDYGCNYIFVIYVCDEQGTRCSEFFYPDVAEDGSVTKTEGEDKYVLTVKNKTFNLSREKVA